MLGALWAMEKLEFLISGQKFTLITDHKAIEEIKRKIDFGTPRIVRWFERLNRFDFEVKHKKGVELVQSDALKRTLNQVTTKKEEDENIVMENEVKEKELEKQILKEHYEQDHRKILTNASKYGISQSTYREVLKKCEVCLKRDKERIYTGKYVETSMPGELIGVDIMELKRGKYYILAIDYFTRMAYGVKLKRRSKEEVVQFIKLLVRKLPCKRIMFDNAREFHSGELKQFMEENNIGIQYSVPHYHQSNGRIERLNRTVRTALTKKYPEEKKDIQLVLKNYNKHGTEV